jgi:putative copper resistance protein D
MRWVIRDVRRFHRQSILAEAVILSFIVFLLLAPALVLGAENDAVHEMHDGMSMPMGSTVDSATQAALEAWKRESEFNHHLAGLLVLVAGLLILADGSIRQRWGVSRHVWPICFLVSGIFLLIFSDTELWPFGSQNWYFGLTHHMEVLQHKVFAVLLLAVGVIELQRARGILKARWAGWVFPIVASAGSLLLLFHEHQGGMTGPNHMELMHRIQSQHYSFAVTGLGIALSKGLAETPFEWRPFFERLFPALLVVLGALLMVYVE